MKRVVALLAVTFAVLGLYPEPLPGGAPLIPTPPAQTRTTSEDPSLLEDGSLRATTENRNPASISATVPPASAPGSVTASAAGSVTGSVTVCLLDDRMGVDLALEPTRTGSLRWATTDPGGRARFDGVPAGSYRVGTRGDGRVLPRSIEVHGGRSTAVTLHAREADRGLRGRLVDREGHPLMGHLLRLERLRTGEGSRLREMGCTRTDATGTFAFEGLPPDLATLTASPTPVGRTGLGRYRPGPMVVVRERIDPGPATRQDLGEVELPEFEGYLLATTLPEGARGEVRLPGARRGVPLTTDPRGPATWASLYPPEDLELWLFDGKGAIAVRGLRPERGRRETVDLSNGFSAAWPSPDRAAPHPGVGSIDRRWPGTP